MLNILYHSSKLNLHKFLFFYTTPNIISNCGLIDLFQLKMFRNLNKFQLKEKLIYISEINKYMFDI